VGAARATTPWRGGGKKKKGNFLSNEGRRSLFLDFLYMARGRGIGRKIEKKGRTRIFPIQGGESVGHAARRKEMSLKAARGTPAYAWGGGEKKPAVLSISAIGPLLKKKLRYP